MPRKIKLMISSRCSDLLEVKKERISYTELRTYVLEEIEKAYGSPIRPILCA